MRDNTTQQVLNSANGRSIGSAIILVLWMYGIVLAKGSWAMFFAIFTPYSLYLSVEAIAKFLGMAV